VTASSPVVVVAHDAEVLAASVAARLLTRLVDAQATRGTASVVLTGGGVGIALLEHAARSPARAAVDWQRVDVWWGDERFVAADDPERNDRQAREALLDGLPLDPARVHPMGAAGGPDGDDVDAAGARYADELAAAAPAGAVAPAFDVLLLGMGPDGHTASLFPEHPGLHDDRAAFGVHGSPKPPPTRVTMGFAALNAAREAWLVVAGARRRRWSPWRWPAPATSSCRPRGCAGASRRCGCWTRAPPPSCRATCGAAESALLAAELGQRLGQDGLAVLGVAALAHVGQVRLVRLGLGRRRGLGLVLTGREAAARAVPHLGHRGLVGERRLGLVAVRAPERDADPRRGLTPLGLAHRTGAYPAASDRVAACHCPCSFVMCP
jgi:6-phosphogluconolactonase